MNRTRSILIFDECVRSFPRLNMEFTVKLVEFQSDGAAPQKARLPRFPFQSSGIRVNNEPIRGPTMCPSVRPSVRTRGNIFRLYRPIPSGFTAFRSISRPTGRSVDQRLSLLSTEPIDHKSGIGVRRPFPLPHPQFVFGFGRRLACLKAANMIERLSVQAEEGGRTQNACQRRIGY